MKKGYFFLTVFCALMFAGIQMVQAQDVSNDTKASDKVLKPQNVGNKICPVTGEKIDEKTKATYEYKGKIYNFCCPMCLDQFKNDPDKYIKKVEDELKSESVDKSKEQMIMPDGKAMIMHDKNNK